MPGGNGSRVPWEFGRGLTPQVYPEGVISTRALGSLPAIDALLQVTKGLAALDAILWADWEGRYYSFNSRWDAASGAQMASMRNGSGDELYVLFSPSGVAIKGFAHESFMSPFGEKRFTPVVQRELALYPGLLTGFPDVLGAFLTEPAFSLEQTTFLVWRLPTDTQWHVGDIVWPAPNEAGQDPDGSQELLSPLEGAPEDYVSYAEEYFERTVSVEDVAHVLALRPLEASLVERLGSERDLDELREDLEEIGYPLG